MTHKENSIFESARSVLEGEELEEAKGEYVAVMADNRVMFLTTPKLMKYVKKSAKEYNFGSGLEGIEVPIYTDTSDIDDHFKY